MKPKSPPQGRGARAVEGQGSRAPDKPSAAGIRPDQLARDLAPLLASKAIPNKAVLAEADMPDTGAATFPAPTGMMSTEAAPSAAESSTDPFSRRREEARALMMTSAPHPTAAETILFDLAAHELSAYLELADARQKLAQELNAAVVGDVRGALALARVLRDVVQISGAIGRRVEHVLTTAASLRAQRRFLELQGGRDES